MKCPSCGAEASGKFCSSCGSMLKGKKCPSCGAGVPPGSKFCTNCGKPQPGAGKEKGGKGPASGAPSAGGPASNATLAWWVAGGMLVVVMVVLGYPILTGNSGTGMPGGQAVPPGMGGAAGGAAPVDLASMTLEEQGTTLFNRVMRSNAAGDTADVEFFLPKALVIYEQLAPTDPDGLYHYALLHLTGAQYEEALAKAQEGLAETPDYLLLLAVAAEASAGLGDDEAAREYYSRVLEIYDTEMGQMRPGYEHHQSIFPVYREEARAYLGEGGSPE